MQAPRKNPNLPHSKPFIKLYASHLNFISANHLQALFSASSCPRDLLYAVVGDTPTFQNIMDVLFGLICGLPVARLSLRQDTLGE